jgi:glycerate kinase
MTKPAGRVLILVAPDKFRGTPAASEAAAARQDGLMPTPSDNDGDAR